MLRKLLQDESGSPTSIFTTVDTRLTEAPPVCFVHAGGFLLPTRTRDSA